MAALGTPEGVKILAHMTIDRWLAVVALALAVLGIPITIFVSRYYYRRSDKKRVPTFIIQSRRALSDPALTKCVSNLNVVHLGTPVGKDGISEAKIYFWNSGTLAMRADDVLEAYNISLPVPILSYSITKASREVTQLKLVHAVPNQLGLSFSVLEAGDGCTFTIVYDGSPNTAIEFNGAVLDSPKPTVLPPHPFYSLPKSKRLMQAYGPIVAFPVVLILVALIAVAIFGGLVGGVTLILNKLFGPAKGQMVLRFLGLSAFVIFILSVIWSIVWPQIRRVNDPYLPPDVQE